MNRILTIACMFLALFMTVALAGWEYVGPFPAPDGIKGGTGAHGVAVDAEGKIWLSLYGTSDSVLTAKGTYGKVRVLYVYNPDGTPAAFSPVKMLTVGGVTDTLWNSARGLQADKNGNILASFYDALYRVNYMTGEGMNKAIPKATMTLTAAAVDDNNNVYVGPVIPGNQIFILDPDFNVLGNAVDATVGYARTMEVSPDGNTVYWTPFDKLYVLGFKRQDEFSPFDQVTPDTLLRGIAVECAEWNPATGYLWLSGGSFFGPGVGFTSNMFYAWDVANNALVDSFRWHFTKPDNPDERPRGIAFSPDGLTAYVGCFGGNDYPAFQVHVKKSDGVGWEFKGVIDGYTLSQNYPNPFNPTTEITFSIGQDGFTTLKVYDMLGREITTLINENMVVGTYRVHFDGKNLPSGTYLYELKAGNRRLTNKMTFTK